MPCKKCIDGKYKWGETGECRYDTLEECKKANEGKHMIIKIDDEIGYWGITAQDVSRQLDDATGDIIIEISSPGGAIYEGISIFNAIKNYDKGSVTTVITSLAASMASVIALAGDKVKAYDNAVYMIHNGSVYVGGDARQLRKTANHLESLTNLMANIYVAKTGKELSEIKKLLDDETYFYGNEMLENGFVDEIIATEMPGDAESSKAMAKEQFDACMMHYKEKTKEDDSDKMVALIKSENLGVNPASAKIKNITKGDSMEYTKEKFESMQAEHAEAMGKATAEAVKAEKSRVAGILALDGDQEVKLKAIEDGSTIGDAAIALNKAQATQIATMKKSFEDAGNELNVNNEQENQEVSLTEEQKKEKEADEALARLEKEKK